jgi:hypothetical protein
LEPYTAITFSYSKTIKGEMKRIYHPYHVWEDYLNGMWRKVGPKEEKIFLEKVFEFTGDAELYGRYMIWAVKIWPIGCEHNLSCGGMNRQAWIGHAAACIAIECPEYITRLAWWKLTQDQQDKANAKADEAIKIWEENYAKDKDWNRRSNSREIPDFMDVRQLRDGLPIVQCGEGQRSDAPFGSGRGQKKEKKFRAPSYRSRRSVQVDNRSCYRLF